MHSIIIQYPVGHSCFLFKIINSDILQAIQTLKPHFPEYIIYNYTLVRASLPVVKIKYTIYYNIIYILHALDIVEYYY